jgi:hypothetical protein
MTCLLIGVHDSGRKDVWNRFLSAACVGRRLFGFQQMGRLWKNGIGISLTAVKIRKSR